MKLFYNNQDGRIFYAVADADLYYFADSTNIAMAEFVIDEVVANKTIIKDIVSTIHKVDVNGDGKYYVQNNQLFERAGWTEDYSKATYA